MSAFGESEASEASSLSSAELSDAEVLTVKRKKDKKKKKQIESSSDDDSNSSDDEIPNEEEICRKEGQGWIVDEDEEDKEQSSSDGSKSDSEKEQSDGLDEEDFDLIQTNLGVNLKRPKKKRRLVVEDEEGDDVYKKRVRDDIEKNKQTIARDLFHDELEDSDAEPEPRRISEKAKIDAFDLPEEEDEEDRDEDDMDDFIVDDAIEQGRERQKHQRKTFIHKDAALQEAQDVFGVDFDFAEFEKYENGLADIDDDEEESEDYDSEMDDDALVERVAARRVRKLPKDVLEKNVKELFDPSDLDRAFFNTIDEKIRKTDIPERFQLRRVPVRLLEKNPTSEEIAELSEEAEWIYNHAFRTASDNKPQSAKTAILQCLKILRDGYEVPFIAFYRKESMQPDLNIQDLWKIYDFDEKWCELQRSKKSLVKVFQRLVDFFEWKSINCPESDNVFATLSKASVLKLTAQTRTADCSEEMNDIRLYYLLYFSKYTEEVKKWEINKTSGNNIADPEAGKSKQGDISDIEAEETISRPISPSKNEEQSEINRERKALERSLITMTLDPQTGRMIKQKRQRTNAPYELASRANIGELVKRFGLSAFQFAQNVNDQYMRHDVDQCPILPLDAAKDFECPQFPTAESALRAARYMLAFEIAREPNVRKMARQTLKIASVINVRSTKKGIQDIDETHPLYSVKYLKDKSISELMNNPIYLHLHNGQKDGLVTIEIKQLEVSGCTILDDLKRFFNQDEFSSLVTAWNDQRDMILRESLDTFLLPQLFQEIHKSLLQSSEQAILKLCAQKIFNYLQVAPYSVSQEDSDIESSGRRSKHRDSSISNCGPAKSARVMSIAIKEADMNHSPQLTAVFLNSSGEVVDFCHAPGILITDRNLREDLKVQRTKDLQIITSFIDRHHPQVIVVGCDSRKALRIKETLQQVCDKLCSERRLGIVKIELSDTEAAYVFANSPRTMSELPNSYNQLMRVAISLGRRIQDPLIELSQLMNYDQDILALRLHPLQDSITKDALWKVCEIEFVNRVNEVGVDVNKCLDHPHTSNLLQFVSGFGPRKATHMLKTMKHGKLKLANRKQLVNDFKLGPRIFMNCAGFLRIDTSQIRDSEDQVEILDSTRVHLESYDLAKKMAIDALEYEDTEDNDPNQALEEIIQTPNRLRELDLDAFAEELKNKGHGDKSITLYDIRTELDHRYQDLRKSYAPPSDEQIFIMATGETPETLHRGKLVECRVNNVVMRKPRSEKLDNANPKKSNDTGLWMCPFCRKSDFQQLNYVWSHFDNNECPGEPIGLQVLMENGINGFVPLKLMDMTAEVMLERFPEGSMLTARVTKIDIMRFNVELTCRESDIKDERNIYRIYKDPSYDYDTETSDLATLKAEEEKAAAKAKRTLYVNRVIFHPNFRNISFDQTCILEPTMQPGEVIIRPSSKGSDHLTLSWKVDKGILTHVDILEKEKTASFALGKKLIINGEEYDDLDEIMARYVQPMSSYLNDLLNYKNYRDSKGGNKEILAEMLKCDKDAQPERIPYFVSASKNHPGYFLLAYMPNQRPHFEYLSISVEGYIFRKLKFPTLDRLLIWFKENYNDPTYKQLPSHKQETGGRSINSSSPGTSRLPGGDRHYSHHHRTPVSGGRTPISSAQQLGNSPPKYRPSNSDIDSFTMPPVHNRTPNTYGALAREYAASRASRQTAA